jgi:mRNA-degrading endonuclease RelE of RelBE toxin-antitoxin system
MYEIEYTPQAAEDLRRFKKRERKIILDGIDDNLRYEPTVETRNRKQMRPNDVAEWELRLGDFRVLYNVDERVRIVEIQRVGEKRGSRFFFGGIEEEI